MSKKLAKKAAKKQSKKAVKKIIKTSPPKGAVTKERVIAVLRQCLDPELQLDVYTLGLIYSIKPSKDSVDIKMTFTTPACPYGPYLLEDIKNKISTQLKVKRVDIDLVFDPPWKPSEEVKMLLGIA